MNKSKNSLQSKFGLIKNWLGLHHVSTMEVNSNLLSRGGVMGRLDYLISGAKIFVGLFISILVRIAGLSLIEINSGYAMIFTKMDILVPVGQLLNILGTAGFFLGIILVFTTIFKRLRDLCGTQASVSQFVVLTLFTFTVAPEYLGGRDLSPLLWMMIPEASFHLLCGIIFFLAIKEGVITNPKTAIPLWSVFGGLKKNIKAGFPFFVSYIIWLELASQQILSWYDGPSSSLPLKWINFLDATGDFRMRIIKDALIAPALEKYWYIPLIGAAFSYLLYFISSKSSSILEKVSVSSDESSTQISKLHALMKDGALTQQEFEEEKKKVLGKAA